ncbi:MAG: J domain-containing protein [Alphaproteobacteria bacterium]|nr:J domain-containing protein [Alphaproteobacteria bacterium]
MQWLLLGIVLLVVVLWLSGRFAGADPAALARRLRSMPWQVVALGAGAIVGLVLLLTGRISLLLTLVAVGLPFFVRWGQLWNRIKAATGPTSGGRSEVVTRTLKVALDHDTGAVSGTVRAGRYEGRALGSLALDELLDLLETCRADDPDSAALVEAYLDREHGPDWRGGPGGGPGGGQGSGAGSGPVPPGRGGDMSVAEALRVLGLDEQADAEAIKAAHRRILQRVHPDRGGSAALAAQANRARDVLLRRER